MRFLFLIFALTSSQAFAMGPCEPHALGRFHPIVAHLLGKSTPG